MRKNIASRNINACAREGQAILGTKGQRGTILWDRQSYGTGDGLWNSEADLGASRNNLAQQYYPSRRRGVAAQPTTLQLCNP